MHGEARRPRWSLFVVAAVAAAAVAAGCRKEEPAAVPTPVAPPAPTPVAPTPAPAPPPAPPKPKGEIVPILRDLAQWDAATPEERRGAAEVATPLLYPFALLRMETFSAGGATHEIAVFRHETTGLEFSLVPGGAFDMGSPGNDPGHTADEAIVRVRLTAPFLIARTECTQAAWDAVMRSNTSRHKGADLPLESTTCYDVEAFCGKARLALPTEAQWEYACRAGTTSRYTCGDDPKSLAEYAWIDEPKGETHPVGRKKPNAFGLFDVHGNVWEWCADAYGQRTGGEATDPSTAAEGSDQHVVRGGSYTAAANAARSAFRYRINPGEKQAGLGFRPVRPVEFAPKGRTKR